MTCRSEEGTMENKSPLYHCDPEKNTKCSKTFCSLITGFQGLCRYTQDIRYAATDDDGNPIEVAKEDIIP